MRIDSLTISASLYEIIAELKAQLTANNISLIGKIVDSGDDVMICCPYHKDGQERRPSAGIRKSDGTFHCLACGETHSLPEVISYCFGYKDTYFGYKWLAKNFVSVEAEERGDITLDCGRGNNDNVRMVNTSTITEEELDRYRYVHPYMYKRGLTDDVIELFDIGYDKQTDSITFPVRYWGSLDFGKCLFIARRSVKTKHFNIPKNMDKPLYGLYEIWLDLTIQAFDKGRGQSAHFKKCPEVYICEGPFDCLRLWCNGKYAVAGFGCLFSDYQITLLEGLPTRKLILALDNDGAGKRAADKLRRRIKNKLIVQAVLPDGRKDIGECTDEEIQNLKEIL